MSRKFVWLSGSVREDFPYVRHRSSRMSGRGRESLKDVQEWSGGPPGCPGVVGRPSRISGSYREVLPYVW